MMLPVKHFTNDEIAEILSVPECVELIEDLFKNIDNTNAAKGLYECP